MSKIKRKDKAVRLSKETHALLARQAAKESREIGVVVERIIREALGGARVTPP